MSAPTLWGRSASDSAKMRDNQGQYGLERKELGITHAPEQAYGHGAL